MNRFLSLLRRRRVDREVADELRAHIEERVEDLVEEGMDAAKAEIQARKELGNATSVREEIYHANGVWLLDAFGLDVKLGLRMLRKSWGLTLVGGLAMAVGIGIAAGAFAIFYPAAWSTLPLDEGDRVVALKIWDVEAQREHSPSLPNFERWRNALRSLEDFGAFRTVERNLVGGDGRVAPGSAAGSAAPVSVAEMTASGFELARVAPLMGRPLLAEDELDAATPVVVIGYQVWQSRFLSDPAVLGRTVRLGGTVHTVVGVMPEGFAFPVNHRFWTPLRVGSLDHSQGEPQEVLVFARLAPGATLEGAQSELATIGLEPSAAAPPADSQLEPRVVPYTLGIVGGSGDPLERVMINLGVFLIILIIAPPSANIAILIYAKTITRQEEFAARYALGASRGRIVAQLFVEVLVLAAGAAGVALAGLRLVLTQGLFVGVNDPFWIDYSDISLPTVLFAAGLAVCAALIAGAVPAIKATGNIMQPGLRALGSRTGMQLGATWTALVVAQVAFSVAALPTAVELAWGALRPSLRGPGFAAGEFLTAEIAMDRDGTGDDEPSPRSFTDRFGVHLNELVRQLKAEPGVRAITVSSAVPGAEPWAMVEIESVGEVAGRASPAGDAEVRGASFLVGSNHVDDAFFEVFDVPLLTGSGFRTVDFGSSRAAAVIVNRTFAEDILGDQNPLGRRVRYISPGGERGAASEPGPWHTIVGVVHDIPANSDRRTIYHPAMPGEMHPVRLSLNVGPDSQSVASRIREITAAIDPTLRVGDIIQLDEIYRRRLMVTALPGAYLIAVVTLSVLLLSAAGLYALMSFTVNQRRREIGIRAALGAQPGRLLGGIFRRAFGQVGAGVLAGLLVAVFLDYYISPALERGLIGFEDVPGVVPGAAALMLLIGLLAVLGPSRRALRVEPTEALREG